MSFVHRIRVRYGECDMQRIVFNANYLAYCDDAADQWFRSLGVVVEGGTWDMVVKKATVTWAGSARYGDELDIAVGVRRWGRTSFDVGFEGSVGERPVFTAELTYVAIRPGTAEPVPVPDGFRAVAGRP